jgi:hypothetical protein
MGFQRCAGVLGLGWALASCSLFEDKAPVKKADNQLIITVAADKSTIAAREAELAVKSQNLDDERERLRQEIDKAETAKDDKATGPQERDLLSLSSKLLKEQAELSRQFGEIAKERDGLLQKVITSPVAPAAPASAPNAAPVAEIAKLTGQVAGREKEIAGRERSIAEREATVAERERTLAQREADLAKRDSACASAGRPRNSGPGIDRASVEKAYKGLLAMMDAKGVLASDLPAAKQKALRDGARMEKGELAQAMEAVEQVEAAVTAISIDGSFVREKSNRVNGMQRQAKSAKAKEEVGALLQEVARAYSDGRNADANRALNNIVHLLEKQP